MQNKGKGLRNRGDPLLGRSFRAPPGGQLFGHGYASGRGSLIGGGFTKPAVPPGGEKIVGNNSCGKNSAQILGHYFSGPFKDWDMIFPAVVFLRQKFPPPVAALDALYCTAR
jgi:hypothetical protein